MKRVQFLLTLVGIAAVSGAPDVVLAGSPVRSSRAPLVANPVYNRPLWPGTTWNEDQQESMLRKDGEALARMYKAGQLSEDRLVNFLQSHVVTASRWGRSGFERGFVWGYGKGAKETYESLMAKAEKTSKATSTSGEPSGTKR